MLLLLFLEAALQLCRAYSVDEPVQPISRYSDFGVPEDPNIVQTRRRPLLTDKYPPPDIDLVVSPNWPDPKVSLGQVAAVTVDKHGQVVVFHRGRHVWNGVTFDPLTNEYRLRDKGPVHENPVVVFHPDSGAVLKTWGTDLFYLPHGLYIDNEDFVWLTDVALHQVFKFPPLSALTNKSSPLLTLGERFKPGNDESHFCKPSAVAVLESGDFFVSDGYCNSRIIKFDKSGKRLIVWGRSTFQGPLTRGRPAPYQFFVPHALTVAEDRGLVCVADRENGRVQCFQSLNGTFAYEISSELFGPRVFSVVYSPSKGGLFYIVNGPEDSIPVQGFIVDANNQQILSEFRPGNADLSNPHDVAVSPDGESVYVAQLDPHRVWKFVRKSKLNVTQPVADATLSTGTGTASQMSTVSPKVEPQPAALAHSATLGTISNLTSSSVLNLENSPLVKAIGAPMVGIVVLLSTLVCLVGIGAGCYIRARRRAYPAIPTEGFKLGQLLEQRDKRGFEQVSTEESDEDRMEGDQPV